MLVWRAFDRLTPRELHDLLRLRADVFVIEQACVFADIDGRDPMALHLMARSAAGGDLLGTLRLFVPHLGEPSARIGRVATALAARGTGLGRAMMIEAIEEAGRNGALSVRVEAQARLEAFYVGLGFARASEDYEEDGILHCAMFKR